MNVSFPSRDTNQNKKNEANPAQTQDDQDEEIITADAAEENVIARLKFYIEREKILSRMPIDIRKLVTKG